MDILRFKIEIFYHWFPPKLFPCFHPRKESQFLIANVEKKEKRDQGWNKKVHTVKLKKNLKGTEKGRVGNWKDMKRRMNQEQKDIGNLNLFDENANKGKND